MQDERKDMQREGERARASDRKERVKQKIVRGGKREGERARERERE